MTSENDLHLSRCISARMAEMGLGIREVSAHAEHDDFARRGKMPEHTHAQFDRSPCIQVGMEQSDRCPHRLGRCVPVPHVGREKPEGHSGPAAWVCRAQSG